PVLPSLIPSLLGRGDPRARELALRLALMAETPELLAALRDFALSQRGPDEQRIEAAHAVVDAGLLPAGPTRLWLQGEWREVLLMGFEITDEPTPQGHGPQVEAWHAEALAALHQGEAEQAERLLTQALQLEPDHPSLLHNLAATYEMM